MYIADIINDSPEENREEEPIEQVNFDEEELKDLSRPVEPWDHVVIKEGCDPSHFGGMVGMVMCVDKVVDPVTKEARREVGVNILGCTMGHDLKGKLPEGSVRGFYFLDRDLIRVE